MQYGCLKTCKFPFGYMSVGLDTCDEIHCLKTNSSLGTINKFGGHVPEQYCICCPLNEVELPTLLV